MHAKAMQVVCLRVHRTFLPENDSRLHLSIRSWYQVPALEHAIRWVQSCWSSLPIVDTSLIADAFSWSLWMSPNTVPECTDPLDVIRNCPESFRRRGECSIRRRKSLWIDKFLLALVWYNLWRARKINVLGKRRQSSGMADHKVWSLKNLDRGKIK